ncbi:uncharacterized protein [Anabrus simplex]|uniref:uncharacterized protein n=1 Tax=Anabrus simplex TaxID=316456 RepID=UPI0035A27DD9
MGSSAEPERSLSSGISIPQWMKTRIGDRYDIEEPFSPPIHDDTFFYIRYPKSTAKQSITEPAIKLIEEENPHPPVQDFSQHTASCRQFIPEAKMSVDMKELGPAKPQPPKIKSQGSDEGFSGDGAACGISVVQVAQQMISGKFLTRGLSSTASDNLALPADFEARRRRGSKSLPASPLSTPSHSPESSPRPRKKQGYSNRYFTGNFNVLDRAGPQESASRYPGSWILSSFLGPRESTTVAHSSVIHEESHDEKTVMQNDCGQQKEVDVNKQEEKKQSDMRRNKSTPILSSDSVDECLESKPATSNNSSKKELKKGFVPKPSELREMNFWSPTSM